MQLEHHRVQLVVGLALVGGNQRQLGVLAGQGDFLLVPLAAQRGAFGGQRGLPLVHARLAVAEFRHSRLQPGHGVGQVRDLGNQAEDALDAHQFTAFGGDRQLRPGRAQPQRRIQIVDNYDIQQQRADEWLKPGIRDADDVDRRDARDDGLGEWGIRNGTQINNRTHP